MTTWRYISPGGRTLFVTPPAENFDPPKSITIPQFLHFPGDHSTDVTFYLRTETAQTHKHDDPGLVVTPLYCSLCMYLPPPHNNAYSIINGQAVCLDHHNYVQGGDHARALDDAKRDDEANTRD